VELTLVEGALVVQPVDARARADTLEAVMQRVLVRRRRAYARLAEGVP
jgi:hypothetical protein